MRTGRTIVEIAQEIERQNALKVDYIADTRALVMKTDAQHLAMDVGSENGEEFNIADTMHRQLATRTGVPAQYYKRMQTEAPRLLANNVNHWLQSEPKKRMLRTMGGTARALLSDRYRPLDHGDLLEAILPTLHQAELELKSVQVTERRLYIQAVSPRLQADVKVGDTVQGGIVISNSEIGEGSLRVENLLYRLICLNGMVTGDAIRKAHVGRSHKGGVDLEGARELFSDRTRELDDAALFSKVRDTVTAVLSPEGFEEEVRRVREGGERQILGNPAEAVKVVSAKLRLTEGEQGGVLRHLIEGGDLSAWGLGNAVTRLAHDEPDYDHSVELERAGAMVVTLPRTDWETVANAA